MTYGDPISIPIFSINQNDGSHAPPFSAAGYENFFTYVAFPTLASATAQQMPCLPVQVDTGSTGFALPRLLVEALKGVWLCDITFEYHPSNAVVTGSLYYLPAGTIELGVESSGSNIKKLDVPYLGIGAIAKTSINNYSCVCGGMVVVGADSLGIHMMGIGFGRPLTGCQVSYTAPNTSTPVTTVYNWTNPILGLTDTNTNQLYPGYQLTCGKVTSTKSLPYLTVGTQASDFTNVFKSYQSQTLNEYTPYSVNQPTATSTVSPPPAPSNNYAYESATPQGWINFTRNNTTSPTMAIDVLLDTGINSMIMNLSDPAFASATSLMANTTATIFPPATLQGSDTSPSSTNYSYQVTGGTASTLAASATYPVTSTSATSPSSIDLMIPAVPATLPAIPSSTTNIGSVNIGINPLQQFAYAFDAMPGTNTGGTILYAMNANAD